MFDKDTFLNKLIYSKREARAVRGIYFLFNGEEMVYVGQSQNVVGRVHQHTNTKEFDSYSYVEIKEGDLNEYEAFFVITFKPKYNATIPTTNKYGNIEKMKVRYNVNAHVIKRILRENGITDLHMGYYDLEEVDNVFAKIKHTS